MNNMTDQSPQTPVLTQIDSKSSIFEKTDPDLRRRIDQALVDRQPSTYKAVYEQFDLQAHGISFTAFYYYATRVRANAALIGLAQVTLPEGTVAGDLLPELLGQRLLDASFDEETSAGTLCRLAHTYRIACEAYYARRRFAALFDDEKRKAVAKENDEFYDIANQFIKASKTQRLAEARAPRDAIVALEAGADPAAPADPPVPAARSSP